MMRNEVSTCLSSIAGMIDRRGVSVTLKIVSCACNRCATIIDMTIKNILTIGAFLVGEIKTIKSIW